MSDERPRLSKETLNRMKKAGFDRYHLSEEQFRALEALDNPEKSHWLAKSISYCGGLLELIALFHVFSAHWVKAVSTGILGLILVFIGYRIQSWITEKKFNKWLRFKKEYITDEKKFSTFVMDFVQRDQLLSALLSHSNIMLFSEGYRPHVGRPNDPEIGGAKFSDVLPYFMRKMFMDIKALLPLNRHTFEEFIDRLVEHSDSTLKSVMVIVLKYNLEIQGKFNFEWELTKIPAGAERETFKRKLVNRCGSKCGNQTSWMDFSRTISSPVCHPGESNCSQRFGTIPAFFPAPLFQKGVQNGMVFKGSIN